MDKIEFYISGRAKKGVIFISPEEKLRYVDTICNILRLSNITGTEADYWLNYRKDFKDLIERKQLAPKFVFDGFNETRELNKKHFKFVKVDNGQD